MDKRSWILVGIITLMTAISSYVVFVYLTPKHTGTVVQAGETKDVPVETDLDTSTTATDAGTSITDTIIQTPTSTDQAQPVRKQLPKKPTIDATYKGKGYDGVLNGYRASGYIFQLNDCVLSSSASKLNTGKGAKFAVQNTGTEKHTYKVFGKSFTLATGEYIVLTATSVGAHQISCDGLTRAEINVQ